MRLGAGGIGPPDRRWRRATLVGCSIAVHVAAVLAASALAPSPNGAVGAAAEGIVAAEAVAEGDAGNGGPATAETRDPAPDPAPPSPDVATADTPPSSADVATTDAPPHDAVSAAEPPADPEPPPEPAASPAVEAPSGEPIVRPAPAQPVIERVARRPAEPPRRPPSSAERRERPDRKAAETPSHRVRGRPKPAPAEAAGRSGASATAATANAPAAGGRGSAGSPGGAVAGVSLAAYGALVAAEINRHKFYPASARSSGTGGTLVVVFTIGPGGTVVSHAVTRSSGSRDLDATVPAMMAATHVPPPPNGRFRGSITLRFSLSP